MGCDIHGVLQMRPPDCSEWINVCEIEDRRNYLLFSILAGVRDSTGSIIPIQKDRGYPADFVLEEKVVNDDGKTFTLPGVSIWASNNFVEMGCKFDSHSPGWVDFEELRNFNWDDAPQICGVISREDYDNLCVGTNPKEWCRAISGHNVRVAAQDEIERGTAADDYTHVRAQWIGKTFGERCAIFCSWMDYVELKYRWTADTKLRIVFDFDN